MGVAKAALVAAALRIGNIAWLRSIPVIRDGPANIGSLFVCCVARGMFYRRIAAISSASSKSVNGCEVLFNILPDGSTSRSSWDHIEILGKITVKPNVTSAEVPTTVRRLENIATFLSLL